MGQPRLIELDVLRGFAVAMMILVVSPGSWAYTYAQMQHANWHGWTFADFVFPDFLFGVGMALGLTFGRSLNPVSNRAAFWGKIGQRVIGLVLIGLLINSMYYLSARLGAAPVGPEGHDGFRIPGILQRIAFAYLIAVLVVFATSARSETGSARPRPIAIAAVIVLFLIGYWALLALVPVPGVGAGDLTISGNLPGYVDRQVFGTSHMWPLGAETWRGPIFYDPEGILATLPASVNVLFGVLAVGIWQSGSRFLLPMLAGIGVLLIASAYLIDPVFPINKKIWTSSFAMLTSGLSILLLLVVAALLKVRLLPILAPLRVLGGNAILAFSISVALTTFASIPLLIGDRRANLQERGFSLLSQMIADPYLASLAYALSVLALVLLLILPLHRKGIHLRL